MPTDTAALGEGSAVEIAKPEGFRDLVWSRARREIVALVPGAVQRHRDSDGVFVAGFNVPPDSVRMAVDAAGNFITCGGDFVRAFDGSGTPLWSKEVKNVKAVVANPNGIFAAASWEAVVYSIEQKREVKEWRGGGILAAFKPDGTRLPDVKLGKSLENFKDIACDLAGNFYILADVNQIHKFKPGGDFVDSFGAHAFTRIEDGSELLHTVSVDAKGNIYTLTWGNPPQICRIDVDGNGAPVTITQRGGQFDWGKPWSFAAGYMPLAVTDEGVLWAGTDGKPHFKPILVKTKPDYLAPGKEVNVRNALAIGLQAKLTADKLIEKTFYQTGVPIDFTFEIVAANRSIDFARIERVIRQPDGRVLNTQTWDAPLKDGEAFKIQAPYAPARFGPYLAQWRILTREGVELDSFADFFGVTPAFENCVKLAPGEARGGWIDVAGQAHAGLRLFRFTIAKRLGANNFKDFIECRDRCKKYGLTFLAQFEDYHEITPEYVKPFIEAHPGGYWEITNEPNFQCTVPQYVKLLETISPYIRQLDPTAKVGGPAFVDVAIPRNDEFFKLGGHKWIQFFTTHDYESHEGVAWLHWEWEFAQLREMMSRYNCGHLPIWQTERAFSGVRGTSRIWTGQSQNVRATLHRLILERLGIPGWLNNFYYYKGGGYLGQPSYLMSDDGPFPALYAIRTLDAMTRGLGRVYDASKTFTFGSVGDNFLWAIQFKAPDGSRTIPIVNQGSPTFTARAKVSGGTVKMVDAYGNAQQFRQMSDSIEFDVEQLPTYVLVPPGVQIEFERIEAGRNVASSAKLAYTSVAEGALAKVNDGRRAVVQQGSDFGGETGAQLFMGQMPLADGKVVPQTLSLDWAAPQKIGSVTLISIAADNQFAALLKFRLIGIGADGARRELGAVDAMPTPTIKCRGAEFRVMTFYDTTHRYLLRFTPVEVVRLEVIAEYATAGFAVDKLAADTRVDAWGDPKNQAPSKLMISELFVNEPLPGAVQVPPVPTQPKPAPESPVVVPPVPVPAPEKPPTAPSPQTPPTAPQEPIYPLLTAEVLAKHPYLAPLNRARFYARTLDEATLREDAVIHVHDEAARKYGVPIPKGVPGPGAPAPSTPAPSTPAPQPTQPTQPETPPAPPKSGKPGKRGKTR